MGNLEPLQLSIRIKEALHRALGVGNAALFLLERDELSYFRVDVPGRTPQTQELPASNPLIEYMSVRRGRPPAL